ncbi:RIMS-binding protein 2 isoform X15 [Anas platyrhynchos]|uniref:RIMS-binding protein 2 isoform X15 n=1 Tax=Anas platyrhynchos TaxID=8839 RepID=UPI000A36CDCA|nr:RIMS-binding protein 2 isoform X13 [Anas platyrhynchos]|eukprot:XP_021127035.1 RIMS-binding protein 2 isoform X6 [Anas platyrhynchos]
MKAISHILDHSYSLLDSPRANQSFPKAAKSLTKEQEEDKVSKKGNNKAKQTSKKLPHCRPEDRSKQKSCSVTPKKSKVVSPSTSLALSSNNTTVITKTITRTFPLKQKMHLVNVKAQHLQNINKQSESIKDLEIQMLQVECEELKNQLGCLREGLMGLKPGDMEELLKQSQKELLWLQRQLSFISAGGSVCVLAASKFGNDPSCLQPATSQKTFDQVQFLEERQISKSDVTTLNQEYHHWQFLKNELKDDVQETNRLSLQYASVSHKALQYDQVKSDYDHLRETLIRVTKERDLAVKGKHQLQAKLENLEQVLKHMREAAERRQQLELEHEQALAVLNAKQQEIELLQKAQVEAKKEHEGAVQLLEAKVRELEEKCRTQSEQFNLLSRELEKFRQQAGKIDLLSSNTVASSDIPGSPSKSLSQLVNGIATSIGKGHESPSGSRCVISEFIRPLQISGDKPEQLSVKPTFLSKSRSGAPRCRFDSDMDNDQNSNTSKQRYSGKVHLCIARYSYNPFDGPNENPEAELPLTAGKYLYVYGDMDEDGFYEGELLDGQRGLVPSNFVDFVQDNETRLSSTLSSEQDQNFINHSGSTLEGDILEISPPSHIDSSIISNGAGTLDVNIDEIGEDIVPYPRKITLIKQLAKSVIVGWEPPVVPPGWGTISSYNVLVDKEVRMNIALGSRTKALIEKLNISTCTYRISVQSITNKGNSDELQCSLLVGKDVIVAPSNLKVDNITQISAELSWLPTNSNYSHVIFLNEEEFDIVKAASYKYHFFNLKPNMAYKVKVMAKPHQMPWQLPLEQREKKEAFVEFSTLPAGPPAPPQDVTVRAGSTPATVQVSWKPPTLTATGTSHGANVTGYGVYVKGQRVAEVIFPTAENTLVELMRLRNLEAKEVTVRTLSAQGESVDSTVAAIPSDLLVPPTPHPRTAPKSKPLASAGAPETKEEHLDPHLKMDESWEQTRSASPVHGHTLEPPLPNFHSPLQGRRSPSPNRILPQPQGTPVPNTVAKAMAREAAQRVAESNRMERRSVFSERSNAAQYANSDDEEDGYDSPNVKRRGASVDDFLKGSELGKQPHYCHGEEYHTESSRGSDLSDIMEEDEEELYSEMQLEDGGRRRVSVTSHNALKLLGNPSSAGRPERAEHAGRRSSHGSAVPQRSRPMLVPSIDGYGGHDHLSPDFYEESETDPGTEDISTRIFVALFDYDPLTMSPNPDAAEEELPFKEGQIIKVYGDKDADGFYRGETCTRIGLIPCNMVSEIQADDEEMMDQLLKQGFLPLNTPVEKIERNRRSGRQPSVSTRRMVALYDYDPRESSPNVDVEAELTFCTGDIITVFGEIDEDGFYYGELNGQKGLVPSNFLEEVPDDVEVYLSDAPSQYLHDTPMRTKAKRVPPENTGTARRAPSPTVHLHSGSPTSSMGSGSPGRGRDMSSKKKKGLLSKGKKLLKKLGAVK